MNAIARKLPIGIQSFEKLRKGGYLYVDKTDLIWQLTQIANPYFLSRPRRFGKSLLLSTLEAYFLGKKELFEGLAIARLEQEWKSYPILHLDLNAEKYDSPEALNNILSRHLSSWEEIYGAGPDERTVSSRFAGIIQRAYKKTGMPVVVLIDEYDKPLLQTIGNESLQTDFRMTLKSFYGVLKSTDPYLRFVFLTGVTKFAQVSIFSDLNQLNDISLDYDYATLCGITFDELTANFPPELEQIGKIQSLSWHETLDTMKRQYDGYHFHPDGAGVFNPFSTLSALQKKEFRDYWFQTGTPTSLVELLKKSEFDLRELIDGVEVQASTFNEYRAEQNNPIPLIYQSGYLTIKKYIPQFKLYRLEFPNEEVRYGFLNFITPFYSTITEYDRGFYIGKFVTDLQVGNVDGFMERIRAFFADFPYELNDRTERHYQVVFYLIFKLMGQFCSAEVRSAKGRADAVVKTHKYIYVFEFKLNGSVADALRQIDEKGYLIPYAADGKQLVKIGASFDAGERNLGDYEFVTINKKSL